MDKIKSVGSSTQGTRWTNKNSRTHDAEHTHVLRPWILKHKWEYFQEQIDGEYNTDGQYLFKLFYAFLP